MSKSKTNMPKALKDKCSVAIHTASAAAAAAGAIPIPVADRIPISAAQITMVIALGKVFDISLTQSAAKSVLSVGLAQNIGRDIVSNLLKVIPGIGPAISATTAGGITETMGWIIADDFYRISVGETPKNITEAIDQINNSRKNW